MEEKILFDKDGVTVTNSRFVAHGRTYAMGGITSVEMKKHDNPNRNPSIFILSIGLLLLAIRLVNIKPLDTIGIDTNIMNIIGIFVSAIGLILILIFQPVYDAIWYSASGQAGKFPSEGYNRNREYIKGIVEAINEAIVIRDGGDNIVNRHISANYTPGKRVDYYFWIGLILFISMVFVVPYNTNLKVNNGDIDQIPLVNQSDDNQISNPTVLSTTNPPTITTTVEPMSTIKMITTQTTTPSPTITTISPTATTVSQTTSIPSITTSPTVSKTPKPTPIHTPEPLVEKGGGQWYVGDKTISLSIGQTTVIKLPTKKKINNFYIKVGCNDGETMDGNIEYLDGSSWIDADSFSGAGCGDNFQFPEIVADNIRIVMTNGGGNDNKISWFSEGSEGWKIYAIPIPVPCPTYTPPNCPNGNIAPQGKDGNGCDEPYICVTSGPTTSFVAN